MASKRYTNGQNGHSITACMDTLQTSYLVREGGGGGGGGGRPLFRTFKLWVQQNKPFLF